MLKIIGFYFLSWWLLKLKSKAALIIRAMLSAIFLFAFFIVLLSDEFEIPGVLIFIFGCFSLLFLIRFITDIISIVKNYKGDN